MKIEFHPQAEEEFAGEASYYERQVPALGASFISELESAVALLEAHPELGLNLKIRFVICQCAGFLTH